MSTDDSAEVPGAQRGETVPAKRSVSEVLGDREHKSYVRYVVALFAAVGLGFGLTGSAGVRMLFDAGSSSAGDLGAQFMAGMFALSVFAIMFLTGPVLGAIAGLEVDRRVADAREAAITAFAGSALGYVVMNVVGVFVTVLLFPSTGSGGSSGGGSDPFGLGDVLVPLFVMAVPVGVVAAGVVYARDRYVA